VVLSASKIGYLAHRALDTIAHDVDKVLGKSIEHKMYLHYDFQAALMNVTGYNKRQ